MLDGLTIVTRDDWNRQRDYDDDFGLKGGGISKLKLPFESTLYQECDYNAISYEAYLNLDFLCNHLYMLIIEGFL